MTSTISASAERQLERRAKHKLAVLRHVEEVSGNVAATCRYYGISRQASYHWLKRYENEGVEGLRDRSSAPHHSPNATEAEVVEKILWLRQQYHFGPQKIAMYLKRYHDLTIRAVTPLGKRRNPSRRSSEGISLVVLGTVFRTTLWWAVLKTHSAPKTRGVFHSLKCVFLHTPLDFPLLPPLSLPHWASSVQPGDGAPAESAVLTRSAWGSAADLVHRRP